MTDLKDNANLHKHVKKLVSGWLSECLNLIFSFDMVSVYRV